MSLLSGYCPFALVTAHYCPYRLVTAHLSHLLPVTAHYCRFVIMRGIAYAAI
jgi:hypothetical protein